MPYFLSTNEELKFLSESLQTGFHEAALCTEFLWFLNKGFYNLIFTYAHNGNPNMCLQILYRNHLIYQWAAATTGIKDKF